MVAATDGFWPCFQ